MPNANSNPSARLYSYKYPHPAVTVDCVIFGLGESDLQVLLIERKNDPHAGCWALPGGFVDIEEGLEAAARRELKEETGVESPSLEQLHTFGEPGRDPRERVISVAYFVLVKTESHRLRANSDARRAAWFPVSKLPPLAFDHALIIGTALQRLRDKARHEPVGFELLPPKFKLPQLQKLYEVILGRPLDTRNFCRRILRTGLLVALNELDRSEQRRPARLYRLDRRKGKQRNEKGFNFGI